MFLEFGFRPLANPVLRRTAARGVTIGLACRIVGADQTAFLAALNARFSKPATVPLTVLDPGDAAPAAEPTPAGCSCCWERPA